MHPPLLMLLSMPLLSLVCTTSLLLLLLNLSSAPRRPALTATVECAPADVALISHATRIYTPRPMHGASALPRMRSSAMRI